jgi:DNA-directed RNA polymerase specialized sigma24 family protein
MLRFYGELSLDEIAEATAHPIGTVKSRLSRGVANLRDQLVTRSAP